MGRRSAHGRATELTRARLVRRLALVGGAVVVVAALVGWVFFATSDRPVPVSAPETKTPTSTAVATHTPTPSVTPTATPTPTTPPPPAPTLTPVPRGTVVAEADVTSPKGSIRFHYRVVSGGDNSYTVECSGFTSTVPVPVSVTLIDIPPQVGDGLTYHGVGDHALGGPTSAAAPASSASLGDVGQPSYLTTLVTYSSAPSADGVPLELGPDKVLAVSRVRWSVPVRPSNVHPVDGGPRTLAAGTVTATTADGAPKRYLVAQGDTTGLVADRFGIPIEYLLWLNPDLPGETGSRYLLEGTSLNLDPDSL